jgi:hypothetical protein
LNGIVITEAYRLRPREHLTDYGARKIGLPHATLSYGVKHVRNFGTRDFIEGLIGEWLEETCKDPAILGCCRRTQSKVNIFGKEVLSHVSKSTLPDAGELSPLLLCRWITTSGNPPSEIACDAPGILKPKSSHIAYCDHASWRASTRTGPVAKHVSPLA